MWAIIVTVALAAYSVPILVRGPAMFEAFALLAAAAFVSAVV